MKFRRATEGTRNNRDGVTRSRRDRLFVKSGLWGLLLACFAITAGPGPVFAQLQTWPSSFEGSPFDSGEKLEYNVDWTFIHLGTVEVSQTLLDSTGDVYRIVSHARSASWIPFVHVNVADWADLRSPIPSNFYFHMTDSSSGSWVVYSSDSGSDILHMTGADAGKDTVVEKANLNAPCYDALGLMMLVRALSGSTSDTVVTVVVDYKLEPTEIIFSRKVEAIRVGAFSQPILAREFETKGKWSDPHSDGTSANMTGWVSADSAAVPLLIKMKLLVGSVNVELESCDRPGWIPPTIPRRDREVTEASRSDRSN